MQPKPPAADISQSDILVVGGRGLKRKEDLELLSALADRLGGQLAVTPSPGGSGLGQPIKADWPFRPYRAPPS